MRFDKPYLVAGEQTPSGQEFYIVYMLSDFGSVNYKYLRSIDGGLNWSGGLIEVGTEPVSGIFPAQPAVSGADPLYVAYIQSVIGGTDRIRFLVGTDVDGPSNEPLVEFSQIVGATQMLGPVVPPLTVPLNRRAAGFGFKLPGGFQPKRIPQLAADPTDPNTLYLVYHDVVSEGSSDSDIFFRKLTRMTFNSWLAGPQIRVNDDPVLPESDQFMPSIVVDNQGRIHVVFFDDRRFDQDDTDSTAKFDAFYAWSEDGGQTWNNQRLFLDPNDPQDPAALDLSVAPIGYPVREYIGITFFEDVGGTHVMTAYHGTDPNEQDSDKSVIWSSRIDWVP